MRRLAALLFSTALLLISSATAQMPRPQFSADLSMKSVERGEKDMTGKMYNGNMKTRMDMNSSGHEMEYITDLTAKKVYIIMPEQHMYMEHDINQPAGGPGGRSPKVEPFDPKHPCDQDHYTCNKVGTEMMNGRMCDKWEFKPIDKGNEKDSHTSWVDTKLGFPIRTVYGNGFEFNLTNIKEGPQPDSLFVIPEGLQKMGGGMFGGMGMPGRPKK